MNHWTFELFLGFKFGEAVLLALSMGSFQNRSLVGSLNIFQICKDLRSAIGKTRYPCMKPMRQPNMINIHGLMQEAQRYHDVSMDARAPERSISHLVIELSSTVYIRDPMVIQSGPKDCSNANPRCHANT